MAAAISFPLWWIWLSVSVLPAAAFKDKEIITVKSGENTTLICKAPDNIMIVVEWSRADLMEEYVLLFRDGRLDASHQHPSFKDRADLRDRQMKDGDVSLILNDVTAADAGMYECRVFHIGTKRRKRAILDSDPIRSITLRVAPSGQTGRSAGLRVGLSLPAVLLVAAAAVVL